MRKIRWEAKEKKEKQRTEKEREKEKEEEERGRIDGKKNKLEERIQVAQIDQLITVEREYKDGAQNNNFISQ